MVSQNKQPIERNERQTQPQPQSQFQLKGTANPGAQSFVDLPMCRQRNVCVECRTNIEFRKRMEQQFGEWKCPEGIPINTPLNEMPDRIRKAHEMRQKQAQDHRDKLAGIKQDILDIENAIPPQASEKLDRVKYFLFPDMKVATDCIHKGGNKKVEQKCCGGKVKMVEGFTCVIKGDASQRICRTCADFEKGK